MATTGQTIEKDDTRYYDEVFQRIKNQFSFENEGNLEEIENESDILYDNVIEELNSNECEIKKFLKSYHVDYFIYKSKPKHFVEIFSIISKNKDNFEDYFTYPRVSRAYEACLLLIGEKIDKNNEDNNERLKTGLKNIGDFLVDNFQQVFENNIAIYLLRAFTRIIGEEDPFENYSVKDKSLTNKKKSKKTDNNFSIKDIKPKLVPNEWKIQSYLKKFADFVANFSNILDYSLVSVSSPFITLLMRKLKNEKYQKYCTKLVDLINENLIKKSNAFHSMIQDAIGSRFIETFLFCSIDEIKELYINNNIIPNIVSYSKHIYANYVIQTLLKSTNNSLHLGKLYDALLSNIDTMIDFKSSDLIYKQYIVLEIIDTCQRNGFSLEKFMKKLMKCFGCNDKENRIHFLRLLLVYETYENVQKECSLSEVLYNFEMKPTGCSIASKLMEYREENIVNGFNNLNTNELEHLCTHNVGSHFIQESLIDFNNKKEFENINNIFEKLKGRFMILCTNKSGSYIMEALWSYATIKQRSDICEELKDVEFELKKDQFARFFINKIGLNFYKRKQNEWKQIQNNEFKKRKMFDGIFNDDAQSSNKKKKNNKVTEKNF